MLDEIGMDVIHTPLEGLEETRLTGVTVEEQVRAICLEKATAASLVLESAEFPTLVADTLVADPDDAFLALGQPEDMYSAVAMLSRLSGRRHAVWTATAVLSNEPMTSDEGEPLLLRPGWFGILWAERALVEIEELDGHALDDLIASGSWMGKAGGYDMAGAMGQYCSLVSGEESTVLGLAPGAVSQVLGMSGASPSE